MLTKEIILQAFCRLGEIARDQGKVIDLAVYGGAAIALAFDARPSTKDVDAVVRGDPSVLRAAVDQVGDELGLPPSWLNDAVKGFLSERDSASLTLFGSFPNANSVGLRVYIARAEYLFAMKCMAMRLSDTPGEGSDLADIIMLAKHLGLHTAQQAMDIVLDFYPRKLLSPKVQFGIEEIMEKIASEDG